MWIEARPPGVGLRKPARCIIRPGILTRWYEGGTIEKRVRTFARNHPDRFFGLKKRVQIYAGGHPAAFFTLYRATRKDPDRAVSPDTQLVIEGFPRSANTFAVAAFRQAQAERIRIAHNLHVPAQVILASRWRIPALVLIREPRDAVVSLVMRDPISIDHALKYYVSFYKTVANYRSSFVLGRFEEVVNEFDTVIGRINARFGTGFAPFHANEESVGKVFDRIDDIYKKSLGDNTESLESKVSRPSSSRQQEKQKVEYELEYPKREKLISEAEALYEYLTARTHEPTVG